MFSRWEHGEWNSDLFKRGTVFVFPNRNPPYFIVMTFFSRDLATSQDIALVLSLAEDPIWHLPQRCGSTLKLRIAFTKAGRSLSLLLLFPEYRSSGAKLKRVLRSPAVKEKREAFLRIKVPAEVNIETYILGHLRLLGNPSLKLPFKRVSLQFLFFQNCVVIFLWSFC